MRLLKEITAAFRDFLFPHSCLVCDKETTDGFLCNNCYEYLPLVNSPVCRFCGRPVKKTRTCFFCKEEKYVSHGRAWMLFIPPVDNVIHHFKYRKKTDLATMLGRGMANIILADHQLKKAEKIIPVPLFWTKFLKRGYNQAALLAKTISRECDMEYADILKRIKDTKTQTRLSTEARRKNVYGAFMLKSGEVEGKNVLLIDDVMTTGATINECARVLKQAGAKEVYSCVAAITPE
ncbi:MAG TPA: ComF family protein [candidate division WOR-3 bacterium]|uniref:ComF family protein n=1 Tax=candidate division WOR-3 bacterium TaxID=2052148 RepID=A0A9C9EMM1_UNCW3|nr:ComF family protein [candidate division WOR-3 bacterium]